ncbi:MAG: hypothetical protein H7098_00190 [Oligoflexus sp.]|nr:hypothetical protein [Pseudopedobacter sp.]
MLFLDYKKHDIKEVNPRLLWEYDLSDLDYQDMRNVVMQRVIERGWADDFYAILNLYVEHGVVEDIKQLSSLNRKDMNFVSVVFHIPLNELRRYEEKQSKILFWNH